MHAIAAGYTMGGVGMQCTALHCTINLASIIENDRVRSAAGGASGAEDD
jgi:hypothetical protein